VREVVVAAVLLGGCAELPEVPRDTCGNLVVEGVEECDGTAGCGAADGANACFFVCDALGDGCPEEGGYQCGADLRCRVPTETFAVTAVQSAGAYGVSSVDMDGDGAAELLGYDSRGLLVRWGDWEGVLGGATRVSLPLTTQETTTLDVDFNGQRDIALPIAGMGYGLFLGDGARGMIPAAQSAISLDFGQDCLPVTVGSVVTGAGSGESELLVTVGGVFMSFLDDDTACDSDPDLDCIISGTPGELIDGRFVSARLGYGPASGVVDAEQFTAAVVGQQTVSVWGEDVDPLVLKPQRVGVWALDEPFGADGHLAFAELDGDGCLDLVADTGSGGSLQIISGQNSFGVCAGLVGTRKRVERPFGQILGIGDVTGDGRAEILFVPEVFNPDGVGGNAIVWYDTETGAVGGPVAAPQDTPISAVVLDYNHDGWNDVVVTYDGVQVVDFFLNYQGTGFSRFPIEVGGVPRRPVVGDFDGDLLEDIVVSVVDPTDPEGRDRGVVVYGEAGGRPNGAQFLGDFLAVARPVKVEGGIQPTTDSVMVVSNKLVETTSDCEHRLSVLIGDTSRQPVSPYIHLFQRPGGAPEPMLPVAVVDLSGSGVPRALALGLIEAESPGDPLDVGLSVLGFDGASYVSEGATAVLPGTALTTYELFYTPWRTGDLDGDGEPEGLTLAAGKALILRTAGGELTPEVQDVAEELLGTQWAELADMDGDGDPDVIGNGNGNVVSGGDEGPVAPASTFWMVENDAGALDFTAPVVLAMPADLYCVAAEVVVSNASGLPQVIAACYHATAEGQGTVLAIGTFDPAADADEVSAVRTLAIDGDPFTLEVADFTGDGLDDVAVVGPTTTTIHRQCRADEVFFGTCTALDPLP
jgi:hypothetical protein